MRPQIPPKISYTSSTQTDHQPRHSHSYTPYAAIGVLGLVGALLFLLLAFGFPSLPFRPGLGLSLPSSRIGVPTAL